MTELEKTKLFYTAIGLISGWLFGGLANILWFFYGVQVLGYGENAPMWYISIQGILRPAVLLLSMAVGYMIAQRNYRLATAEEGYRDRGC
jgi:peptidoglycan biosynthesis protein MviN/MurJ (putative lipid II flippase)